MKIKKYHDDKTDQEGHKSKNGHLQRLMSSPPAVPYALSTGGVFAWLELAWLAALKELVLVLGRTPPRSQSRPFTLER